MATTTKQDRVRELQRALYRAAKAEPHGDSRMPAVKNVGEPCAGEPHARFEVAAGGNRNQSAVSHGTGRLPPTLHTPVWLDCRSKNRDQAALCKRENGRTAVAQTHP